VQSARADPFPHDARDLHRCNYQMLDYQLSTTTCTYCGDMVAALQTQMPRKPVEAGTETGAGGTLRADCVNRKCVRAVR